MWQGEEETVEMKRLERGSVQQVNSEEVENQNQHSLNKKALCNMKLEVGVGD